MFMFAVKVCTSHANLDLLALFAVTAVAADTRYYCSGLVLCASIVVAVCKNIHLFPLLYFFHFFLFYFLILLSSSLWHNDCSDGDDDGDGDGGAGAGTGEDISYVYRRCSVFHSFVFYNL